MLNVDSDEVLDCFYKSTLDLRPTTPLVVRIQLTNEISQKKLHFFLPFFAVIKKPYYLLATLGC